MPKFVMDYAELIQTNAITNRPFLVQQSIECDRKKKQIS